MANTKTSALSSQKFLTIDSIRDGIVVLKNGGLRAVLMVSSVNFDLKSADEQDATIYQYQNVLNSLDFSVQFVVQSRKLNILPYLSILQERQKAEQNDLVKIQIAEYTDFIKSLVELSNIVSKTFYVIIPFAPSGLESSRGFLSGFSSLFSAKKESAKIESEKEFTEHKTQLIQRVDTIAGGLQRIGVRSVQLNTEELIELYYGLYNPVDVNAEVLPSK
jgi:hypothetical protein